MWDTLLTVSVYSVELYLWVKTVIQTGEDPISYAENFVVQILDICWNVIVQPQFWIQTHLIYSEYLFANKENTILHSNTDESN